VLKLTGIVSFVNKLVAKYENISEGKKEQQLSDVKEQKEVEKSMNQASANSPKTNDELIEVLEKGKLSVATLILLGLASCSSYSNTVACPQLKEWTPEQQMEMKTEMQSLSSDSILWPMFKDYSQLRNQVRACNKEN
jgi:hypothetical protein